MLSCRHFLGRRKQFRPKASSPQECLACGICCDVYGAALSATAEDLFRWRDRGRLDLVERIGADGRIWTDPATGQHLESCPFLRRIGQDSALCLIHEDKPALCRDYPTRAHGFRCVRGVRWTGLHD